MEHIEELNPEPFIQEEIVVKAGERFEHVMAIALDPRTDYTEGVIRCIVSREGDVMIKGYVDRSEIYTVRRNAEETFDIDQRLTMKNEEEILNKLGGEEWDYIGHEDPDIFIDENNLMHLYFTMPFRHREKNMMHIHLGHAVGKDLNSLEMTMPVLLSSEDGRLSAKEVSIAPLNSKNERLNLFESSSKVDGQWYSTVRVAAAKDMGKPWEFGEVVFHPAEHDIPWVGEHASPGPLLPRSFIDLGENKLLGIMNGREKSERIGDKIVYKNFTVGLCIYDYERGQIEWVSPEPLIKDTEAKTITFASQFVETEPGKGTLYAHVDDSFVRRYSLDAKGIKKLLPKAYCQ
jgi:hypothetical protein